MGGDVVDHEAPPARVIECASHQHVDLEHRLGGERASGAVAWGQQVGVDVVEVIGPKPTKVDVAEPGDDVVVDHPRVPVGSRRRERPSLAR